MTSPSLDHSVPQIAPNTAGIDIARWLPHFAALASYSALLPVIESLTSLTKQLPENQQYRYD